MTKGDNHAAGLQCGVCAGCHSYAEQSRGCGGVGIGPSTEIN